MLRFFSVLPMLCHVQNELNLPAFAKINLTLRILGKRSDGFHDIYTVFQTVSLHDDLRIAKADKIEISCNISEIPTDSSNLVYQAVELLREKTGTNIGANIHLTKRIPSPGGLGGGSSNAAAALIGVARLWELDVSLDELASLGARIGSDVPFFLYGGTAIGTGRGTHIKPVDDHNKTDAIIVAPRVPVESAFAYSELALAYLTKAESKSILEHYREGPEAFGGAQFGYKNDFESGIFERYNEIKIAADKLRKVSASVVSLSGSGPCVFGLFEDSEQRDKALVSFEMSTDVPAFSVSTVTRKEYLERMGLVSS